MLSTTIVRRMIVLLSLLLGTLVAAPPTSAGSQDSAAAVTGPEPTVYTSFEGDRYDLLAYSGEHVALLVPDTGYDDDVIAEIVTVIDAAYDFYAASTGREPGRFFNYNGLASVAVVDSTCGAGCGHLGLTGIEMLQRFFDILYDGVNDNDEYDQVVFYELGRNFWSYGNQIAYYGGEPDVNPRAPITGFAVFMRFLSMDAAGVDGGPFRGRPLSDARQVMVDMLATYLADDGYTWENTLRIGQGVPNEFDFGGADLWASFLFDLQRQFGDEFVARLWHEVGQRPSTVTTQDAVDNFVIAASYAADRNLADLFDIDWKWPLSETARQELADHFAECPDRVLFVAGSAPAPSGDASLLDAVRSHVGEACVEVVDDDTVTVASAESVDVVVISSSVSPSVLADRLVDADVPILVSEPYLFDDMAMVDTGNGRELAGTQSIYVDLPGHPLAAGRSGWVSVYTSSAALNYGFDQASSDVDSQRVALVHPATQRQTLFGIAKGGALTDRIAPASRVGFFAAYGATLSTDGIALTHAALDWLVDPGVQCGDVITTDIVLDRSLSECPQAGLVVGANGITIDLNGQTLDGDEDVGYTGGAGVAVNGFDGVTIRNGFIRGFSFGVELKFADGNLVENVEFRDNAHAIEMHGAADNIVRDITSWRTIFAGLRLTNSDRNTVERVTVRDAYWGVLLERSDGNLVMDNDLVGGPRGFWQGVGLADDSDDNVIRGNMIRDFRDFGIYVRDAATGNLIEFNDVARTSGDGIHTSPISMSTLTGNTSNDNGGWGIRALGDVTDGGGNTASGNAAGQCIGVSCDVDTQPTGLLVVGSTTPPSGDRQMVDLIEAAGVELTLVDDDSDLTAIDPNAFDAIFISTSVVPGKVGATFEGADVPVVVWEPYLYDDMAMAASSGETPRARSTITITDVDSPISVDLAAGDLVAQSPAMPLSYGVLGSAIGAQVIAHEPHHPDRAVVFVYEPGAAMVDRDAPAVRVGLFPTYRSNLTPAGADLVTSTIRWVLGGGEAP